MNEAKYRDAEARLWRGYGVQPDEKRITLAGTGTRVRVQVIGDGDPVIFIHGGPNAGSTWAPIVGAFAGRQCLLVDRPGTGLSDPLPGRPTGRTILELADGFIADVVAGLELDTVDVVASSFGGFIALRSAMATPERFRRMVQMACPALVPGSPLPPFMRMMARDWVRRIMGLFPPNGRVSDNILRQIGHGASLDAGRIPQLFKDWYLDLQRYTDTMKHDGDLIGTVVSPKGMDTSLMLTDDVLGAVATPTLFLWGVDDGFGGAEIARRVVGAMSNAALEMIDESGHLPWLDFPAEIGARARAFLDGEA